jgi:hypothetical protein
LPPPGECSITLEQRSGSSNSRATGECLCAQVAESPPARRSTVGHGQVAAETLPTPARQRHRLLLARRGRGSRERDPRVTRPSRTRRGDRATSAALNVRSNCVDGSCVASSPRRDEEETRVLGLVAVRGQARRHPAPAGEERRRRGAEAPIELRTASSAMPVPPRPALSSGGTGVGHVYNFAGGGAGQKADDPAHRFEAEVPESVTGTVPAVRLEPDAAGSQAAQLQLCRAGPMLHLQPSAGPAQSTSMTRPTRPGAKMRACGPAQRCGRTRTVARPRSAEDSPRALPRG